MDAPQLQQPKKAKRDIRQLLEDPRTQSLMKALATRHLTPDRLTRLAAIACQKVPKLLECDPQTLLGAFLGCSALGLEPNTPLQHLHLIPFENRKKEIVEVQVVIGYRGYLELGRRSGLITGMHADIVYPGDVFEHEYGTNTFLRHQSKDWAGAITDYTHAYCHVALKDGQAFVVMPRSAILRIRDGSQGYKMAVASAKRGKQWVLDGNPWVLHEPRMARKTPIRQLFGGGEVPLSLEMAGAITIDESKVDFAALTHASAEEIKENLGGFVEAEDVVEYDEDGVIEDDPQPQQQAAIEDKREAPMEQVRTDEREKVPVEEERKMAAPRGRNGAPPTENAADMFR
jgi:recombination protein RecT